MKKFDVDHTPILNVWPTLEWEDTEKLHR